MSGDDGSPLNTLESRIVEDLKKSGFASEIVTESIFFEEGWDTSSGNYCFDLDENKVREYDIHAFKAFSQEDDDFIYTFRLNLVGEVKKAKSPWVVIEKFDEVIDAWQNIIEHSNLPGRIENYTKIFTECSILHDCEGSGIHESFKDPSSSSRWYSAVINSIKASEEILKTGGVLDESIRLSMGEKPIYPTEGNSSYLELKRIISVELIRPIVILDGVLYAAKMDGDDIS